MGAERVDYYSDEEFRQAQREEEMQEYQRQENIEAERQAEEEHYRQLEEHPNAERENVQVDATVMEKIAEYENDCKRRINDCVNEERKLGHRESFKHKMAKSNLDLLIKLKKDISNFTP